MGVRFPRPGDDAESSGDPTMLFRILAVLLVIAHAFPLHAESEDERRVKAGARLFRAMLSADVDIAKKADGEGDLAILIIRGERDSFEDLASQIIAPAAEGEAASIKSLPLRAVVLSVEELRSGVPQRCAGLFLAGRLPASALGSVIEHAREQGVIAFSPFEGDVEQGVSGGLSIEARVKPYVNAPALARAGVHLREKFMKVAKTLE